MPGGGSNQGKDFLKIVYELAVGDPDFLGNPDIGRLHVFYKLPRNLFHRLNKIHNSGGDGTSRHTVVFGGIRVLDHGYAASAFDRF